MLARWHAKRSLQAEVAWFVSASVLVAVSILTIAMFVAESRGWPGGLPPLGADYAEFYMIGKLQGEYGVARLYDLGLQDRILHDIVPRMPSDEHLPFIYPSFLALAFRLLARLPYPASFAAWIAITAPFYAASLVLVLHDCPTIPRPDRIAACLLAASFEPFAMECVLGGQLSAIGCFGVAAALVCDRRGQPVLAGFALALLSYKPTLLVLVLPMLVAGGRWRTLAGFLYASQEFLALFPLLSGRKPRP